MGEKAKLVKIERSRYSADFQLVRAMLSAAAACLHVGDKQAVNFIDTAIKQLMDLRMALTAKPA